MVAPHRVGQGVRLRNGRWMPHEPRTLVAVMSDTPGEKYLEPYRQAIARLGAGFEATLWCSRETQMVRFDVMIDLAGFQECMILDAGCGPGDFAERLHAREVAFKRYIGVDALEPMIARAGGRSFARAEFHVADFVSDPSVFRRWSPDYVCISGALNTMEEELAHRVVAGAFEAASRGVVFNFLSDRYHPKWARQALGPAHRFNTLRWIAWSLDLSVNVSFTQAYLEGHDATIMIRHD